MKLVRFLSLAVLACQFALLAQNVGAQSGPQPAEFPPASFKGLQYVDSKGCVYIRAGVDGNVTWVPRVNRARDPVCGFKPTQVAGTSKARPAPKLDDNVVVITNDTPPAKSDADAVVVAAPAAQPAARPAARPAVRTAPATTTRRPVQTVAAKPAVRRVRQRAQQQRTVQVRRPASYAAPAPQRIVKPVVPRVVAPAQRRVVRAPQVAQVNTQRRCRGLTPVSDQYVGRNPEFPVRCDHLQDPVTFKQVPAAQVAGNARILPKHLYQPPLPKSQQPRVPAGYKRAWEDDRLNPRRAEGTLNGKASMDLIWTRTVPRRLIDRTSGRDMTAANPKLFYPFVNLGMQQTYLASKDRMQVQVSKSGKVRLVERGTQRRVIVSTKSTPKAVSQTQRQKVAAKTQPAQRQTVRKTTRTVKAPAGHHYVQVGTFGVEANARNTAARLQRLGLPVTYGKVKRNGKVLRNVLAGPFTSAGQANVALRKARGAGFRDAFVR